MGDFGPIAVFQSNLLLRVVVVKIKWSRENNVVPVGKKRGGKIILLIKV